MATKKPVEKPAVTQAPVNESQRSDLEEVVAIAATLKKRTLEKRRAAEAARGAAARAHFAELRKRLVADMAELRKLQPGATMILRSGQDLLDSDVVLLPQTRDGLERMIGRLQGCSNGKHAQACEDAISELDGLGDDSQLWPKEDRYGGAKANLGDAKEAMRIIKNIVKEVGANAIVKVRREVEHHPLAIQDTEGRVISNIDH